MSDQGEFYKEQRVYPMASFVSELFKALTLTSGPVLECGGGFFSTHLLHFLCGLAVPPRKLVTLEEDESWYKTLFQFNDDNHGVRHVGSWNPVISRLRSESWSVALIDNEPLDKDGAPKWGYAMRRRLIEKFKGSVEIFVLHDADSSWVENDRGPWEDLWETFRYVSLVKHGTLPGTMLLSDTIDIG